MKTIAALIISWMLLVSIVNAAPTTGIATGITSNGFNSTLTGVTGTDCWIEWGDFSGGQNWATPNATASAGTADVSVLGSPIYGGESVYFQGCDLTGCGNERQVTISAVTPMPTTTFGKPLTNITRSRWDIQVVMAGVVSGYTTVTPATVLFGIAFLFLMIGIWMRTKSVRLIAVLGIIISPFIMYTSNGLMLGMPSIGHAVAQGLLAAGLAGVLFSFMRK